MPTSNRPQNTWKLIALVASEPGDSGLFDRWKILFTLPTGEAAPEEVVNSVEADDSIIGWTAANVLKRLAIETDQEDRIVHMSYHGRAVIRWRACHVMGSAFKEKFRGALLDRVRERSGRERPIWCNSITHRTQLTFVGTSR